MRLSDLIALPVTWRTVRAPLRYLRNRRSHEGAAHFDVELRDGTVARLRGGTRDGHVFHRIFVDDEYRLRGLDLTGAWVVDVGAHGGYFALRAAMAGARVVCVEPAPDNLALLRHQIARNALQERIVIRPGALGAVAGRVTLRCDGDPYAYAVARSDGGGGIRDLDVACSTLAELFDEVPIARCALLKLDCEGSEYEIIESVPQSVLERCDRIRMELHFTNQLEDAPNALRRRLEGCGFRIELCDIKRNRRQGYLFCSRERASA